MNGLKKSVRSAANRLLVQPIVRAVEAEKTKPRRILVPIDKLLLGGDCGLPGAYYARLVNDPLRTSRPVSAWPHTALLRQHAELGDRIFDPAHLRQTPYYRNARQAIDYTGRYFSARTDAAVAQVARDFVARYQGEQIPPKGPPGVHSSLASSAITVRPLFASDFYEVVDGHHRAAIAYLRGEKTLSADCIYFPRKTALMEMVSDVLWQQGRIELYQPLEQPEFARWAVVRQCQDRFNLMRRHLETMGLAAPADYRDLGASYGWFVAAMSRQGFTARGIEMDPFAIRVGEVAYGLAAGQVERGELSAWLQTVSRPIEIVSCFSVLHHFLMGNGPVPAEEFIRLIDRATGRVLFIDTGEEHEAWFSRALAGWNAEKIARWLKEHTRFQTVTPLGRDQDNRPPYADNYGRMLFACSR